MMNKVNKDSLGKQDGDGTDINQVEETRRRLMTKLTAGAFAVPAVLVSMSAQAQATGSIPPG